MVASNRRHFSSARRRHVEAELDDVRTHTTPNAIMAEANADPSVHDRSTEMSDVSSVLASRQPSAGAGETPALGLPVPRVVPAALRGSHDVLVHQNIIADVEGLTRIQDADQLRAMVRSGDLVTLPVSSGIAVDPRLPGNRRYCRSWTAKFLSDLSRAHEKLFGDPLLITSAVRTVDFQRHLSHYNGNAAPWSGDTASPHLTGEAVDIGKKGMSLREIAWMRAVLGELQSKGKLDVEEEFEQACFHVSVYKTYAPTAAPSERMIVDDAVPSSDSAPAVDASAAPAIGGLEKPVNRPAVRTVQSRRARHAVVRRRRHHHHAGVSLLAAGMR